jgi:tripartite-type tricarboxylate transporter receptor subunit TctC
MKVGKIGAALLAALMVIGVAASPASAQLSKDKPIRILVPYAAGGVTDIVVRLMSEKVTAAGGPPIVIENKPGGGGIIAATSVKEAAPDGLTLFLADVGSFAINMTLMNDVPYDPVKDFKPIIDLFSFPSIVSVPTTMGVNSLAELVAKAKTMPGGMPYASQGPGTGGHLMGEMFAKAANIPVVHVPYKGGAPAVIDLVAGRVNFMFGSYLQIKPQIDAKELKILAVNSKKRLVALPEVPTLNESGYAGVDLPIWFGLAAPAGTPDNVILAINKAYDQVSKLPDVVARLDSQGVTSEGGTVEQFGTLIKSDIVRLAPIVRDSGAKVN